MNYYKPLVHIVGAEEEGRLLKSILQNQLAVSRKLLSRLKLTDQGITVNGERQYISIRVKAGDRVEVRMEEEESEDIFPQEMLLNIIDEDDHLLILNKPAGIVVHPTHGHYLHTLANGVVHYWKQQGKNYRFRPIHRLDQETSGVLAIAKNPYVQQNISEQMKAGKLKKEYFALVHGRIASAHGQIYAPIDRDPLQPHLRIIHYPGYEAYTRYEVDERFHDVTSVRLWLETGRTHQIRVHMKAIGHPLIGDKLYGMDDKRSVTGMDDKHSICVDGISSLYGSYGVDGNGKEGKVAGGDANESGDKSSSSSNSFVKTDVSAHVFGMERHALHAAKLGFYHPADGEWREYEAELPSDMTSYLQALQKEI